MKVLKIHPLLTVLCLIYLFSSCTNDNDAIESIENQQLKKLNDFFIKQGKQLDFRYIKERDVISLGDVEIDTDYVDDFIDIQDNLSDLEDTQTRQQLYNVRIPVYTWEKYRKKYNHDITVYLHSDLNTSWRTATKDAMNELNSYNTRLRFVESRYGNTSGSERFKCAAIRVTRPYNFSHSNPNAIAYAQYPAYGYPGKYVVINKVYDHYTANNKKIVMMHELLHTIGYMHTDEDFGFRYGNFVDPNSVINAACCNGGGKLSIGDINAFRHYYQTRINRGKTFVFGRYRILNEHYNLGTPYL